MGLASFIETGDQMPIDLIIRWALTQNQKKKANHLINVIGYLRQGSFHVMWRDLQDDCSSITAFECLHIVIRELSYSFQFNTNSVQYSYRAIQHSLNLYITMLY